MNTRQKQRIEKMEVNLDASRLAIDELTEAVEKFEAAQDKFYELENYYGSAKWMEDYEADEAGRLPENMKKGVLSEDAVYDLLTEHRELMTRLQRIVLRSMEERVF